MYVCTYVYAYMYVCTRVRVCALTDIASNSKPGLARLLTYMFPCIRFWLTFLFNPLCNLPIAGRDPSSSPRLSLSLFCLIDRTALSTAMAFAGGIDVSASAAVRSLPLTCHARLAMRVSRRQIAPLEASRRGMRRGQRRGGGVGCKAELQSDNLRREVREATLEAIESSDSGRLTPGDAAAASGLPLTEAEVSRQTWRCSGFGLERR